MKKTYLWEVVRERSENSGSWRVIKPIVVTGDTIEEATSAVNIGVNNIDVSDRHVSKTIIAITRIGEVWV